MNVKASIILKSTKNTNQKIRESSHFVRPKSDLAESLERTKRRRIAQLTEINECAVSALLNENQQQPATQADSNEIICLIMETAMSKSQYMLIKNYVNSKISFDLFPSYQTIVSANKKRYPENISVDESHAEIKLQILLDNTAMSILELQGDVIKSITDESIENLTLIGKWGFDGSTGHSDL